VSAREILAYAITHAPKGVKGGPYEGESGPPGEECDSLRDACRWPTSEPDARECATMYLEDHLSWLGDARVIRIVRKAKPPEASAVEVLRSFIAWVDCDDSDEEASLRPIEEAARRILAASGPDPMPVVRAAMRYLDYGPDGRLGPVWVGFREAGEAYRKAVDAYRKAGGK